MKKTFIFLFSLLFVYAAHAGNYPYHSDVLWVTTPSSTNWLYQLKQEATVTVSLYEYGMDTPKKLKTLEYYDVVNALSLTA